MINPITKIGKFAETTINTLLLLIIYFLGIGITAVISKIVKKKFLETKIDLTKNSYWETTKDQKKLQQDHYKQF